MASSSSSGFFSPPVSPKMVRKAHSRKRYRKVPIGVDHEAFLVMMVDMCLGGRDVVASDALHAQERVVVNGTSILCSGQHSEKIILDWFDELVGRTPDLIPLFCADWNRVVALPLARAAFDALVTRGHLLKVYPKDELRAVEESVLMKEASRLFSEEEILRLAGSQSSNWPRDRFNPYTHTPAETVAHQAHTVLKNFQIPYLLANLTVMFLRLGGLDTEGVFRISAELSSLESLKRLIVTESWTAIAECEDVHVITGTMKSYFSSLHKGPMFANAAEIVALGPDCEWPQVEAVIRRSLDPTCLNLLWWWVALSRIVAHHEHTTCMGLKQIAVVWAPCFVKQDVSAMMDMKTITEANATIQAFVLCILNHHPRFSLGPGGKEMAEDTAWLPISAPDYFANYVKPRDPALGEDFVELEDSCGSALLDEEHEFAGLLGLIESLPLAVANEAMESLFFYLWWRQVFFPVFSRITELEVESTQSLNSLFRLNSHCTKLLKSVINFEGRVFLQSVLDPVIKDMSRINTDMNPQTAVSEEDRRERIFALSEACSLMILSVTNSLAAVSPVMRKVAEILFSVVSQKWPESEEAGPFAVSGFFFLRFVCPYLFNISSTINLTNVIFACKQIAKLMQALANGSDLKESDWPDFSLDLIMIHKDRVKSFLCKLATPCEVPEKELYRSKVVTDNAAIDGFEDFVLALREHATDALRPELLSESARRGRNGAGDDGDDVDHDHGEHGKVAEEENDEDDEEEYSV